MNLIDPVLEEVAFRNWWTNWRNYWHDNTSEWDIHKSEWISLVEGEQYYVDGYTYEGGGVEHFTVSVEIKPDAGIPSDHPNAQKTI
jgi:hypothetical protein